MEINLDSAPFRPAQRLRDRPSRNSRSDTPTSPGVGQSALGVDIIPRWRPAIDAINRFYIYLIIYLSIYLFIFIFIYLIFFF